MLVQKDCCFFPKILRKEEKEKLVKSRYGVQTSHSPLASSAQSAEDVPKKYRQIIDVVINRTALPVVKSGLKNFVKLCMVGKTEQCHSAMIERPTSKDEI